MEKKVTANHPTTNVFSSFSQFLQNPKRRGTVPNIYHDTPLPSRGTDEGGGILNKVSRTTTEINDEREPNGNNSSSLPFNRYPYPPSRHNKRNATTISPRDFNFDTFSLQMNQPPVLNYVMSGSDGDKNAVIGGRSRGGFMVGAGDSENIHLKEGHVLPSQDNSNEEEEKEVRYDEFERGPVVIPKREASLLWAPGIASEVTTSSSQASSAQPYIEHRNIFTKRRSTLISHQSTLLTPPPPPPPLSIDSTAGEMYRDGSNNASENRLKSTPSSPETSPKDFDSFPRLSRSMSDMSLTASYQHVTPELSNNYINNEPQDNFIDNQRPSPKTSADLKNQNVTPGSPAASLQDEDKQDGFPSKLTKSPLFENTNRHPPNIPIDSTLSYEQSQNFSSNYRNHNSEATDSIKDSRMVSIDNEQLTNHNYNQIFNNNTGSMEDSVMNSLEMSRSLETSDSEDQSILSKPLRKSLLQSPVLHVLNSSTCKARYLFLFNDLLIIANPVNMNIKPTLDSLFQVKHIVEMSKITFAASPDRDEYIINSRATERESLINASFTQKFAMDSKRAIDYMIEEQHIKNDPGQIATLLHRSSNLSKRQLGLYLANQENKDVLITFLGRLRFEGLYIDEALRIFLMSVCLPSEQMAINYMMTSFAKQWYHTNRNLVKFDNEHATKLTFAMMELNNSLHQEGNNEQDESREVADGTQELDNSKKKSMTMEDFVNRFRRENDRFCLVPDDYLEKVYRAIRDEELVAAWDEASDVAPQIPITLHPPRLPERLILGTKSDVITVSIPEPDRDFYIRLHGQDLRFEPSVLDFSQRHSRQFRITAMTLGLKSMMMIRSRANGRHYSNLPTTTTILVERRFMQWTFQIAFADDDGTKRRFVFSVDTQECKQAWIQNITKAKDEQSKAYDLTGPKLVVNNGVFSDKASTPRIDPVEAAEAVALQVLKDALIPDENAVRDVSSIGDRASVSIHSPVSASIDEIFGSPGNSVNYGIGSRPLQHNRVSSLANFSANGGSDSSSTNVPRNSLLRNSMRNSILTVNTTVNQQSHANYTESYAKTGHEIIQMAVQNSLLPVVLGFLKKELGRTEMMSGK